MAIKSKTKQYIVIGLGRFGTSAAKALEENGAEVLAVDKDEQNVDAITPFVTQAVQADATDEEVLASLELSSFDGAVVAMGSNIRDSILISIQCKEAGIPLVISKATDDLHAKVLRKVGVDQVIFPEREMARRLARTLTNPTLLDIMDLPNGYEISKVGAPAAWFNRTLGQLNLRKQLRLSVLTIYRGDSFEVSPSADSIILPGDQLLILGQSDDIARLQEH